MLNRSSLGSLEGGEGAASSQVEELEGKAVILRVSKALWIVLTDFVELCYWITESKKILLHMSM